MSKILVFCKVSLLASLGVSLFGCASTGHHSRTGKGLFIATTEAGSAGPAGKVQTEGEACSHNILGLVAFGDSSIEAARRNGGIERVSSVDHDYLNILGFYGQVCTLIRGSAEKEDDYAPRRRKRPAQGDDGVPDDQASEEIDAEVSP